jgi:tartrate-resistant acid phosphatase type 5
VREDFDVHFEEFLHVAGLAHDKALIAWGGFYFRRGDSPYGEWRIVDDQELSAVAPTPRSETIGAGSEPFGHAIVELTRDGRVVARAETDEHNHVWVEGLEPDTEYRYRVLVDGRPWGEGELRDWSVEEATLVDAGRRYDNRVRTFPAVDANEPVTFAVLGDFGVGIVDGRLDGVRQLLIARALERAVDTRDVRLVITTGDNIYLGHQDTAGTGNEDDEWYSSFYEPYRYILNRVPFFPTVGNHDAGDSESSDDRDQLADNFFLDHRFGPEVEAGSASLDPGLFYRFQVGANLEFVCIDTSIATGMDVEHYFDDPAHSRWVEETLRGDGARWRIPFSHHPPFCAGPEHTNTIGMVERLVPLYEEAGIRVVLSGHEHNFQYAVVNDVHYVVSGASGKLRTELPGHFDQAGTRAWAPAGHFLLGRAADRSIVLRALADVHEDGTLEPIDPVDPQGRPADATIEIRQRP